jgi:hypothetical protein
MNSCLFVSTVADFRDYGRNRHNTDWKEVASYEVVQETALAGLEPSQHGNADVVLSYRRLRARKKAGKRGNFVPRPLHPPPGRATAGTESAQASG